MRTSRLVAFVPLLLVSLQCGGSADVAGLSDRNTFLFEYESTEYEIVSRRLLKDGVRNFLLRKNEGEVVLRAVDSDRDGVLDAILLDEGTLKTNLAMANLIYAAGILDASSRGLLRSAAADSSAANASALPALRVDGNRFVNDSGKTVVLRGVSFSDPDRLESVGHWDREYFETARSWGANVVRFPIHPSAWRSRGAEAYLRLVDRGVEYATELGMYVIIDWHSIGNLRTEQFFHERYETTMTETLTFWQTIAERYVGNTTVAFYELFNEPTQWDGQLGSLSWDEHREIVEDIIEVIYAYDSSVIPLVGGLDWSYNLSHVLEQPIAYPNVAYVSHPYPQKRPQPWEQAWERDFGHVADTYPIVATEFGFMTADGPGAHIPVIGDETYGEAIVGYFERKGISWTAWVFDPQWSPQMFSNWSFEPTMQGAFFRRKMLELNGKD